MQVILILPGVFLSVREGLMVTAQSSCGDGLSERQACTVEVQYTSQGSSLACITDS